MQQLIRWLAVFLAISLAACQSSPSSSWQKDLVDVPQAACQANPYLQHFDCRFDQIVRTAHAGDPDAQYALGYLYFYGLGANEDRAMARFWIERAAAQKQPLAIQALALMDHPDRPAMVEHPKPQAAMSSSATKKPVTHWLPNYQRPKQASRSSLAVSRARAVVPVVKAPSHQPSSGQPERPMTQPSSAQPSATAAPPQYTLQLAGSADKAHLLTWLKQYPALAKAKVTCRQATLGHQWCTALWGDYRNHHQAMQALAQLPASVKAHGAWVRKLAKHAGAM